MNDMRKLMEAVDDGMGDERAVDNTPNNFSEPSYENGYELAEKGIMTFEAELERMMADDKEQTYNGSSAGGEEGHEYFNMLLTISRGRQFRSLKALLAMLSKSKPEIMRRVKPAFDLISDMYDGYAGIDEILDDWITNYDEGTNADL